MLPAFLAARLSATLDEIERVVDVVEGASSVAAAAEVLRPDDDEHAVTSISAAAGYGDEGVRSSPRSLRS